MDADDHAFRADERNAQTSEDRSDHEDREEQEYERTGSGLRRRAHHQAPQLRLLNSLHSTNAGYDDVTIAQESRGTNLRGFGFLPKTHAANFVLAPLADIEMSERVDRQPDRRVHNGFDAKQTIAVLEGAGRFLRHEPRRTATAHVLVFVTAVAVSRNGRDDA